MKPKILSTKNQLELLIGRRAEKLVGNKDLFSEKSFQVYFNDPYIRRLSRILSRIEQK